MELFDSHVHLDSPRFRDDLPEVIERAHQAGVKRMVSCGSDWGTSEWNATLAAETVGVYAAVGVHAHSALSAVGDPTSVPLEIDGLARIAELASQHAVVAIGEIGLDYHYDFAPRPVQRAVLSYQLELAADLDMPVILHNRESDEDMRDIVDGVGAGLRGVLHCFTSNASMAQWAVARGLYLGVAGPVTFRKSEALASVLRDVPLTSLLVETDCPWLAPHPHRGTRNEPAYVKLVMERLSAILDLPAAMVAQATTENACRLFGLP